MAARWRVRLKEDGSLKQDYDYNMATRSSAAAEPNTATLRPTTTTTTTTTTTAATTTRCFITPSAILPSPSRNHDHAHQRPPH